MTYLSGKAQKKRSYVKYALCVSVFLIIVIFWPQVKAFSYKVLEPVTVKLGFTGKSLQMFPEFFGTYITSHKALALKNKNLASEIDQLTTMLSEKDAALRELTLKQTGKELATSTRSEIIVMYPLMQDVTKVYQTVLLSKGFKDGIDVGNMVYVRGNQAVCTIIEVYNASSKCLLLTADGVTTEGVTSSSSVNVSLVGRGGHYLANILRDTPVTVGEIVYLRSNPKIVLGKVKSIANNNQDTSWHVFVEGVYNPVTTSSYYVQH